MPTTIDWPATFPVSQHDLVLVSQSRSGGPSLSGVEYIEAPQSAVWQFAATVNLMHSLKARKWYGFLAQLQGRYNRVRIPLTSIAEVFTPTYAEIGWPGADESGVPFDDDATFDDGVGFAAPERSTVLASAAAVRATTVVVEQNDIDPDALPGALITIGTNEWLHRITAAEDTGANLSLTIWPPLREALSSGETATLDAVLIARLATDDAGHPQVPLNRLPTAEIQFVEALKRA